METRRDTLNERLSEATLADLPMAVERPAYARADLVPGIVHFGPGAFHRAHQAAYADAVLADDPRWGIAAVALNSTGVADALVPQDGLYTLATLGAETRLRVIGSLLQFPTMRNPAAIVAQIAAPTTRLITATVTEKGYALTGEGGLDFANPAIVTDLAEPDVPTSYIGWLVHSLAERRRAGNGGLTILSCDNLAANGRRQRRAVLDFAEARDPDLARWIADVVRFPSSMVDSITPATDDALRARVAGVLGITDAWPIQRETFTQWVIEDDFAGERPPFDAAGAQFVRDVAAFEDAKLRLLNGAHSALAYLGLLLGHDSVGDAMNDPSLARFVEAMMRDEVAPTLGAAEGLDLSTYVAAILTRFRNPAIRHSLWQIAWDGSQKLPFRLFGTMVEARAQGGDARRLAIAVAAWFRFLALPRPPAPELIDPLADRLLDLAATGNVDALIDDSGIVPEALRGDAALRAAIRGAFRAMDGPAGVRGSIETA